MFAALDRTCSGTSTPPTSFTVGSEDVEDEAGQDGGRDGKGGGAAADSKAAVSEYLRYSLGSNKAKQQTAGQWLD